MHACYGPLNEWGVCICLQVVSCHSWLPSEVGPIPLSPGPLHQRPTVPLEHNSLLDLTLSPVRINLSLFLFPSPSVEVCTYSPGASLLQLCVRYSLA